MIIASITLMIGGIAVAWVGNQSRHDRLPLNGVMGLRTRTTMRSDDTWYPAQRAGAELVMAGGAVALASGLVSLFFLDDDATGAAIVLGGAAITLVLVVTAGARGQRAAREVLERPAAGAQPR